MIRILELIGKYGLWLAVMLVIIGQAYILPELKVIEDPSDRAFFTVLTLFSPFIVIMIVFMINIHINLPIEITKIVNEKLFKKD